MTVYVTGQKSITKNIALFLTERKRKQPYHIVETVILTENKGNKEHSYVIHSKESPKEGEPPERGGKSHSYTENNLASNAYPHRG